MKYRGREIEVEVIGNYFMPGGPKRIKEYSVYINDQRLSARTEDELYDKMDEILGSDENAQRHAP